MLDQLLDLDRRWHEARAATAALLTEAEMVRAWGEQCVATTSAAAAASVMSSCVS